MSTPRSVTPQEDIDRPMPGVLHRSVGTPDPSNSPSPPSTPRAPRLPSPPRVIVKHDASTMASIELPPPPPPVIIQPARVPSPPPAPRPPPKAKTPSPVSSTSSSSSSSSLSSSTLSTSTPAYSSHSSTFSDHQWLDLRSEGQIDPLGYDRPRTELIMKHAQLLLEQRRRSSTTTAGLSFVSPPTSPAGATHTLSIGEVPPHYPSASAAVQQHPENGHTTPSGSDESNHSGKSEGELNSSLMMGQQRQPIHIKYHRSTVLNKKKNGK